MFIAKLPKHQLANVEHWRLCIAPDGRFIEMFKGRIQHRVSFRRTHKLDFDMDLASLWESGEPYFYFGKCRNTDDIDHRFKICLTGAVETYGRKVVAMNLRVSVKQLRSILGGGPYPITIANYVLSAYSYFAESFLNQLVKEMQNKVWARGHPSYRAIGEVLATYAEYVHQTEKNALKKLSVVIDKF